MYIDERLTIEVIKVCFKSLEEEKKFAEIFRKDGYYPISIVTHNVTENIYTIKFVETSILSLAQFSSIAINDYVLDNFSKDVFDYQIDKEISVILYYEKDFLHTHGSAIGDIMPTRNGTVF